MASRAKSDNLCEVDDIISRCGSLCGETFSSRRSRQTVDTLRQQGIDAIARKLRDSFPEDKVSIDDDAKDAGATNRSNNDGINPARVNKFFHKYRFLVAMFGGSSVGVMFLLRYNITVSILKMVNQTYLYLEKYPDQTVDDMIEAGFIPGGEMNWNNEIQHMIMSWYMIAYTLPQFPATKLGNKIGARLTVPISLAICAVSTLLTPYFAYKGWEYVIVLRLINGLGASSVFPMMVTLMESWMRSDEISLGISFAQTIVVVLAATNPLIAGYLSEIHWSYSFYVPGIFALIFCVAWFILITDNPMDNHFVSEKELMHIYRLDSLANKSERSEKEQKTCNIAVKNGIDRDKNGQGQKVIEGGSESKPDSWRRIFCLPSFYAYLVIWTCYCSSYSGFMFILPAYLRQFLRISIAQNGLYCFIVQSGAILAVLWPHPLLMILENKLKLSTQVSRRLVHLIICSTVAATWLYVGTFHEYQLFLLFLNRCFHNSNDIVLLACLMSNYAEAGLSSVVFSLVNTVGNLSVVFSSTFIGWFLDYTAQSDFGWQMIFSGLAVSQLFGWLIFATLVSSGPIKFKNKRQQSTFDFESQFKRPSTEHQSVVHPPACQMERTDKSIEGPIMNNFNKLKDLDEHQQHVIVEQKGRESRQI